MIGEGTVAWLLLHWTQDCVAWSESEHWPGLDSKTLHSNSTSLHPDVWVLANLLLGGYPCNGPSSDPGGIKNTPSHFVLPKPAQAIMVLWDTPAMTSILSRGSRNTLRCFTWYLLCNISNTSNSVSSGYPNTEKRVENTTCSGVFLTKFKVFG